MEIFLGKSQICDMTLMSGALCKSVIDENTILFKMSEENDRHRYLCIAGDMIFSLLTNYNIYK